jgi:hypothetical protein
VALFQCGEEVGLEGRKLERRIGTGVARCWGRHHDEELWSLLRGLVSYAMGDNVAIGERLRCVAEEWRKSWYYVVYVRLSISVAKICLSRIVV